MRVSLENKLLWGIILTLWVIDTWGEPIPASELPQQRLPTDQQESIPSWDKPIPASELIEKSQFYDGKEVVFQGEAIGDKMVRGTGVWVNLLDSSGTALGVWLKTEDAKIITFLGSYNFKGDLLAVKGVFNRACKSHMGEIDLHAISCHLIQIGYPVKHSISATRLWIMLSFLLLSIGLIILWWRVSKPSQPSTTRSL